MASTMKQLIESLNAQDFRVFAQKSDPKKQSITANGSDGKRYFVTRVACGTNEDGTARYMWARGAEMRPQVSTNSEVDV
jgi:hypothetical protein